ncbi:FAD-dependent oxidoreductase [Actinomycetospora straminea]|uniref:NAD(P)/FAD-dependent oxidoreductase n=1 Tax=Actinomycetospora straminea TaxID=663607 RepID=A0ABP9EES7_9PSEU|nr:NAD(P)/FAD-dependent oxidoreductase [Actinomycetospora straminea]MDD7932242.1 NAD(P)/FAD-dependent oxidoreductase [Actinomycetospora straminea]
MSLAASADRPVTVVGAGPVGLVTAWSLADAGVPVRVLEADPVNRTDWRASTFHAATMELLAGIDGGVVTDEMLDRGLRVPRYQYRDRATGLVAEFDLGLLADETRFPFRLQLNQQRLVEILLHRLGELGVELRFASRVSGLVQDDTGAVLSTDDGATHPAALVVGTDGAGSAVRKLLGRSFEGMTYPQRFLIISVTEDLRAEAIADLAEVSYIADPDEFVFVLRTPESWRVLFPIPPEEDAAAALDPAAMQRRLRGFADIGRDYGIVDRQIYAVHQRVADRFHDGRVVLAGDAAHINSPMGGMGLNAGIHDAVDLGRRLVRASTPGGDLAGELAAYDTVRRGVARDYVRADTHRNTQMMAERDPAVRAENQAALRATAADPDTARAWLRRASLLTAVAEQGIGRPLDAAAS